MVASSRWRTRIIRVAFSLMLGLLIGCGGGVSTFEKPEDLANAFAGSFADPSDISTLSHILGKDCLVSITYRNPDQTREYTKADYLKLLKLAHEESKQWTVRLDSGLDVVQNEDAAVVEFVLAHSYASQDGNMMEYRSHVELGLRASSKLGWRLVSVTIRNESSEDGGQAHRRRREAGPWTALRHHPRPPRSPSC